MLENASTLQSNSRYSGTAIGLHWLIAALIIGMLAVGKLMTELDIEDPLRFELTQWHKSFGIAILALSAFRLYWRSRHQPPVVTIPGPAWEKKAASITHAIFYVLLVVVPLTGWLLVSTSPLNIPTILFKTLPWPHVPLPASEFMAEVFYELHQITSNLLLVLLLLHVGAALRHQFILKNQTLSRMSLLTESGKIASGLIPLVLILLTLCGGVLALNKFIVKPVPVAIAAGEVRFTATLMGNDLVGSFDKSEVEVRLDPSNPASGMLNAVVQTGTLQTGDSQVNETLLEQDWFNPANFPAAIFTSTSMLKQPGGGIEVNGSLTIKETSRDISFPVSIESIDGTQLLSGGFAINRLDYQIGAVDQPDDGYAGFNVLIEFSFALE